jgi:hypothetical protein
MPPPSVAQVARTFQAVRTNQDLIELPALVGLGAGLEASRLLPCGGTYDALLFQCTVAGAPATDAQLISDIESVDLILDSDSKVKQLSGADLIMLHKFNCHRFGYDTLANEGILPIFFGWPGGQEIDAQDGPAWGTADIKTFECRFKLAGGAVINAVKPYGLMRPGENLKRHWTCREVRDTYTGTGKHEFSAFDYDANGAKQLKAIHMNKAGGLQAPNIFSNWRLWADRAMCGEGSFEAARTLQRISGLVPQTGWSHLEWALRGRPLESLPLIAQDMRLELNCLAAPNTYRLLMEQYEG